MAIIGVLSIHCRVRSCRHFPRSLFYTLWVGLSVGRLVGWSVIISISLKGEMVTLPRSLRIGPNNISSLIEMIAATVFFKLTLDIGQTNPKVNVNVVQCVQEKLCFFAIHCSNPFLAYIAVRDLQSSKRKCECTVTPIGW